MIDPSHCNKELTFLHLEGTKNIYKCSSNSDAENKPTGAFIIYSNETDGRLQYSEDKYIKGDYPPQLLRCIGRAMSINAMPYSQPKDKQNPTKEDVEDMKRRENLNEMLACALAQAFDGSYETSEIFIDKAQAYYQSIATERARKCSLWATGYIVMVLSILAFVLTMLESYGLADIHYGDWLIGMYMGAIGAAISVWQRYGKTDFTGYASKLLYRLEVVARVTVGVIFSIVLIAAVKEGWISSRLIDAYNINAVTAILLGFVAGFSERLVPIIAEHFADKIGGRMNTTENDNKKRTEDSEEENKDKTTEPLVQQQ